MKVEIRADGMHISGYVNVPGRPSRPMMSALGKFIEVIEPGVFRRAIRKTAETSLLLDHDKTRVLSSTKDKTLIVTEDNVGLRAETVITDAEVIKAGKEGKLRGWSFGMVHPTSHMEERAEGELPIRRITEIERLPEVTLVLDKIPCYQSTSIEVRSGEEALIEYRACMEDVIVEEETEPKKNVDLSEYKERLKRI